GDQHLHDFQQIVIRQAHRLSSARLRRATRNAANGREGWYIAHVASEVPSSDGTGSRPSGLVEPRADRTWRVYARVSSMHGWGGLVRCRPHREVLPVFPEPRG